MKIHPMNGRSFELRALDLARAIHDPHSTQGSVMVGGREHDGIFVDHQSITIYEFTQERRKEKATKDGGKIADALERFTSLPENRFKAATGYFVTQDEPTADQRTEIQRISQSRRVTIHAISFATLKRRLIDAEQYIRLRDQAPFGSADFAQSPRPESTPHYRSHYVDQRLTSVTPGTPPVAATEIASLCDAGETIAILGDYGTGKSEALRQCYQRLRKQYLRNPDAHRIPVHLNLRDMYGLRSASEVMRRHAEQIGFGDGNQLISAWRSGGLNLILDGFDELIPARWSGGVRDLRGVRKGALHCIRELISETPAECGIVVAGRAQYFSGNDELRQSLNIPTARIFTLQDFDENEASSFIGSLDLPAPLEWVPRRPLILRFVLDYLSTSPTTETVQVQARGEMWRLIIGMVSQREADRVPSVTSENIRKLISRVSLLCRKSGDVTGPVSQEEISAAFTHVCGYQPDEDGIQLVMRLPGLAGVPGSGDARKFIDEELAEAAFGFELADYVVSPYHHENLGETASWQAAGDGLAAEVAASEIEFLGLASDHIKQALRHRRDRNMQDAITLEIMRIADDLDVAFDSVHANSVQEVIISRLSVSPGGYVQNAQYADCLIEFLDLSGVDPDSQYPDMFQCIVNVVSGATPTAVAPHLKSCEIGQYDQSMATTDSILDAGLAREVAVGLSILKKVYLQKGAGRKIGALARGLPLNHRELVPSIIDDLESAGYLHRVQHRGQILVLPDSAHRESVAQLLASPPATAPWATGRKVE